LPAPAEPRDPGVRNGTAVGGALNGISGDVLDHFKAGADVFAEVEDVEEGLGPRLNLDSCGGCHAFPALGGTSPAVNPQVAMATKLGAANIVPAFIRSNGPIREVRFINKPDGSADGGVHALYVITGRSDASGCNTPQEDFATQVNSGNVSFRIPTPTFGLGLVEAIADKDIVANLSADADRKRNLGISGKTNRNGNDGTVTRFGWKAQNKSLLIFSGEAYNVEMGVTNELFQNERDETVGCIFGTVPEDHTNAGAKGTALLSDTLLFERFMRFLAPPTPSNGSPGGNASITRGKSLFTDVGCNLCHTPSFTTQTSSIAALSLKPVNLYSDLALHDMGPKLADSVVQGRAEGDEFRSAPLWGLGQRIFLLHDGRTSDLVQAIQEHKSAASDRFGASEANGVVDRYNALKDGDKQDLLNFLRSL
jgi:CxxC motif-containing protein (DUF1111 family)